MLGERTAEEVKMTLGSAFPLAEDTDAEIRGRDQVSGLPRTVVVSSSAIRQAMEEPLTDIVDAVRRTLDQTPPELAGDIMDRGIVLTGGGALLRGLDDRLRHETGMPVHVADDPLTSVAMGAAKCVEEFAGLQQVFVPGPRGGGADGSAPAPGRAPAAPFRPGRAAAGLRDADHPRLPRRHRLARGAGPAGDGRGVRARRVGRGERRTPAHRRARLVPQPLVDAPRDRDPRRPELRPPPPGRHLRRRPQPPGRVRRPHQRREHPRAGPGAGPRGRHRRRPSRSPAP